MKYLVLSIALISSLAGCNDNGNPTSPMADSVELNNLVISLTLPAKSFRIGDTLDAKIEVYNPTSVEEQFSAQLGGYEWSLTRRGQSKSIMISSGLPRAAIFSYPIKPHQTVEIKEFPIRAAIKDYSSGVPVTSVAPGYYILNVKIFHVNPRYGERRMIFPTNQGLCLFKA